MQTFICGSAFAFLVQAVFDICLTHYLLLENGTLGSVNVKDPMNQTHPLIQNLTLLLSSIYISELSINLA